MRHGGTTSSCTAGLGRTNCREHEDMSAQMLDYIVDANHIDAFSETDLRRVKVGCTVCVMRAPVCFSI